ncbi:hypothetical protein PHJA_001024000 [Phtheirospermum japonicum]|uniref:S-protein homolog n=1 Tax=Phtheirospermum japonicum TaxID=374723 RepID=A0A830BYA4_9LAMI|nr:hypothetical protein PHJA_001024000 [Phtheirospermum japonicum]
MKILFLLFLTVLNIFQTAHTCFLFRTIRVHVFNSLPSNSTMRVHCASGDDDLGYHTLSVNQQFQWKFCETPRTLFFCHLWWGKKQCAFDAFVGDLVQVPKSNHYWYARSDAIHLSYDNISFEKGYIWH